MYVNFGKVAPASFSARTTTASPTASCDGAVGGSVVVSAEDDAGDRAETDVLAAREILDRDEGRAGHKHCEALINTHRACRRRYVRCRPGRVGAGGCCARVA